MSTLEHNYSIIAGSRQIGQGVNAVAAETFLVPVDRNSKSVVPDAHFNNVSILVKALAIGIVWNTAALLLFHLWQTFITLYWRAPPGCSLREDTRAGIAQGTFAIPMLGRNIVLATTRSQIEDINRASVHDLSLSGAIYDRILPQYVIHRSMNVTNVMQTGQVAQHVLKRHLRVHLPVLREKLIRTVDEALKAEIDEAQTIAPGELTNKTQQAGAD
ncbi:MAG: hypothetical protein Q9159_001129 [Coniocarpon cinnabarinum]